MRRNVLEVKDLVRNYRKSVIKESEEDVKVLKGINFQVAEGEFVGIMGKSGCGKTTLLKTLGMIDKPTDGTIKCRPGPDGHGQAQGKPGLGLVLRVQGQAIALRPQGPQNGPPGLRRQADAGGQCRAVFPAGGGIGQVPPGGGGPQGTGARKVQRLGAAVKQAAAGDGDPYRSLHGSVPVDVHRLHRAGEALP